MKEKLERLEQCCGLSTTFYSGIKQLYPGLSTRFRLTASNVFVSRIDQSCQFVSE